MNDRIDLRRRAEDRLSSEPKTTPEELGELQRLVHELRVHRIELELQNEELLQARSALRKSQAQCRAVAETSLDGFLMMDETGRILATNDAYVHRSGYSRRELLNLNFAALDARESREEYRRHLEYIRRQGSAVFETSHLTKGGERWPAEVTAAYRADAGGCFFAFVRDITARKQAEQALLESRARLASVINTAGDAIISVDESQCIRLFNRAAEHMFGMVAAEAIGMPLARLVPDRYRAAHRQHLKDLRQTHEPVRLVGGAGTAYGLRANGEEFPIEAFASKTRLGDGALCTVIIHDVTNRMRTEATLRELRAEMEQLLTRHVASQTAMAIAHELNQPLNAMVSFGEAALRLMRLGNPKPDKLLRAVEGGAEQAQRAGQVMRELVDYLQSGESEFGPMDLNAAVKRALSVVEAEGQEGVEIAAELDPGLRHVRGNRLQIEKVVVNLARNGIQAMARANAPIRLITISARTKGKENMAQVIIRDSGPGVEPSMLGRIFDAFYTTHPKGLGLGLAISRSIIESHGGTLWIERNDGPGATFCFTLPHAP